MTNPPVISICQLNCRSISTTKKLIELEEALSLIRFDVIGLSELWKTGSGQEELKKTKHRLYYSGGNNQRRGTGFIVARHMIPCVKNFGMLNDRCCFLDLTIKRFRLRIVQGYAPTSADGPEIYARFLKLMQKACKTPHPSSGPAKKASKTPRNSRGPPNTAKPPRASYTVLMADFNAQVGKKVHESETIIGEYGYGERNERGTQLAEFCARGGWKVASTFSKQREGRKWTWRSPNGQYRREYDLFLVKSVRYVKSVRAINQFNFRSDHRLCRMELEIPDRPRLKRPCGERKINWPLFQTAMQNSGQLTQIENIDERYDQMKNMFQEAAEVATEYVVPDKRLSDKTTALFAKRHLLVGKKDRDSCLALVNVNKALRVSIADDIERRTLRVYQKTMAARRVTEQISTPVMFKLSKGDGTFTVTKDELEEQVKIFYEALYSSSIHVNVEEQRLFEQVPPVLKCEVEKQLKRMKKRTAPGHDSITTMMLRNVETEMVPVLANLFTQMLHGRILPKTFADSVTTLIHKSGDKTDLGNYRPISVLPAPFKLFTRIVLARVQKTLEENQSVCQAGFRRGYGTTEHLQTITQIMEKAHEYRMQIYMVFIDYKKAYDSVEWNAVWNSLNRHGVEPAYIEILKTVYQEAKSKVKVDGNLVEVEIARGVRQGCVLSPVLFNAVLEDIFRSLDWEGKGINMNEEWVSHLAYADDVVIFGRSLKAVQGMLNELDEASRKVGLEISAKKTRAMGNMRGGNLSLRGEPVEFVATFKYLGCNLSFQANSELSRRIASGWGAFNKHQLFLTKRNVPMEMKRKVFQACIVPSLLYGCEVWKLKQKEKRKLRSTQRRMERAMLGITLLDRVKCQVIRERTKLPDILDLARERKFNWAKKIVQLPTDRWSRIATEWCPEERKRKKGRPRTRWADELTSMIRSSGVASTWMTLARRNQTEWKVIMDRQGHTGVNIT